MHHVLPAPFAAVQPLTSPSAAAMEAWIAEQLADLTPEERAMYERSEQFRGIVRTALEYEWQNAGPTPIEREAVEKYDGDMSRCFVERFVAFALREAPAGVAARVGALRAERYGANATREMADIQTGEHPAQQLPC